jgi:hypothetical protein
MCVELGNVGELGELGRTVEGEVQNDMPNCMKWFVTGARMRVVGVGSVSGRILASESVVG